MSNRLKFSRTDRNQQFDSRFRPPYEVHTFNGKLDSADIVRSDSRASVLTFWTSSTVPTAVWDKFRRVGYLLEGEDHLRLFAAVKMAYGLSAQLRAVATLLRSRDKARLGNEANECERYAHALCADLFKQLSQEARRISYAEVAELEGNIGDRG